MKSGNLWKGGQLLGLSALVGGMLAGCQTAEPVREYRVIPGDCPAVVAAPPTERLVITTPRDRYFNPLTRSWERPWPYGPYDTANWR